ncbi:zinc-ribbon domain-containing protein [Rhodopseudomonas palustris]|uniref:MJ0042-type zinc finger domain-containing protein n=1 Tax=Rhodopseudomonas palustris TaxID=1076 RepID=UPI0022F02C5B|nr:MJ0042-type zinc finger domain-containing protein [Rhodopseudomonas palustris]WBU29821.1 zinc-ribbon domain-containing protein [Rhodopseudomonas palustris]
MHIVCPHCTTSYAIDPAKLGDAGRTVRCSRCKEVWLARPEDVQSDVRVAAMTVEEQQPATNDLANDPGWGVTEDEQDTPVVESPPITADLPGQGDQDPFTRALANEPAPGDDEEPLPPRRKRKPSFGSKRKPRSMKERLTELRKEPLKAAKGLLNAPLAIAVFGSVALGLLIWRADIVRLMPQTAAFYRLIGFEVNLRGLAIKDVRISRETVESKPVLVIEGVIVGQTKKTVDVPRLRFSVRDAKGTEIYAWNAILEQQSLQPGEIAWFRTRLASPPAEARAIDVRFFNRRDIAAGGA